MTGKPPIDSLISQWFKMVIYYLSDFLFESNTCTFLPAQKSTKKRAPAMHYPRIAGNALIKLFVLL